MSDRHWEPRGTAPRKNRPTALGKAFAKLREFWPIRPHPSTTSESEPSGTNLSPVEREYAAEEPHFSIRELLVFVSSISVLLALARWLWLPCFVPLTALLVLALSIAIFRQETPGCLLLAFLVTAMVICFFVIVIRTSRELGMSRSANNREMVFVRVARSEQTRRVMTRAPMAQRMSRANAIFVKQQSWMGAE